MTFVDIVSVDEMVIRIWVGEPMALALVLMIYLPLYDNEVLVMVAEDAEDESKITFPL